MQIETLKNDTFGAINGGSNSACREDTVASHRRAVERVITTARERLGEPISLRDMSRVAYLSAFHFNRVFHEITGLPPAKFISAMRLDEAKRLLLNTEMSITDICFDVGFMSLGTFSRTFREIIGETPSSYRDQHGPMVAPNCVQMWAMRPRVAVGQAGPADRAAGSSSFGEAVSAAAH